MAFPRFLSLSSSLDFFFVVKGFYFVKSWCKKKAERIAVQGHRFESERAWQEHGSGRHVREKINNIICMETFI